MARFFAPFLLLWILSCASEEKPRYTPPPTLDEYINAEVRTVGRYVLADPFPRWVGPPDQVPCELGTIFGTHFDLIAPPVPAGFFLLVTVWSRAPLNGTQPEYQVIGNMVQTFTLPFDDPSPGTYLTLMLNEGRDLVPGRYRQLVTTGSGRELFSHEFIVPECPAA